MKQTGSTLYLTDTIYCYNGYLYLIQCEGGMGKLVRIHTDGSARETIADLFANTGVSSISLVFHEMMSTHMMIPDMQVRRKKQKKLLKKFR